MSVTDLPSFLQNRQEPGPLANLHERQRTWRGWLRAAWWVILLPLAIFAWASAKLVGRSRALGYALAGLVLLTYIGIAASSSSSDAGKDQSAAPPTESTAQTVAAAAPTTTAPTAVAPTAAGADPAVAPTTTVALSEVSSTARTLAKDDKSSDTDAYELALAPYQANCSEDMTSIARFTMNSLRDLVS